jgi:dGTP triphosphohydrolase
MIDLLRDFLPPTRFNGELENRRKIRHFTHAMSEELMGRIEVKGSQLIVSAAANQMVKRLKRLTFSQVIDRPAMLMVQEGQRRTIRELFTALLEWYESDRAVTVSPLLAEIALASEDDNGLLSTGGLAVRVIADFIAALTDREAVAILGTLTGRTYQSAIGPWNR